MSYGVRRARWSHRLRRRLIGRPLQVWHSSDYRPPLAGAEARAGADGRRADLALWALLELGVVSRSDLRVPQRVRYGDLALVHDDALLDSLVTPEGLGRVFALPPAGLPVDELLRTVRLAVGGTLAAARETLRSGDATLNLLGGFHHAGPGFAGGLSAVNDIAVALAVVRREGFSGTAVVLDLDCHPPDGTSACLAGDPHAWIGSISGMSWPSDGAQSAPAAGARLDETVLPAGSGDTPYLDALHGLLARMPSADLAFVVAGGDVLGGDQLGNLNLSLRGVRARELAVADALDDVPTVWLPGGGYHRDAWRALTGVGLAVSLRSSWPIPARYDPLRTRYARIASRLHVPRREEEEPWITEADLGGTLGLGAAEPLRLLDRYTAEAIEQSLHTYGLLAVLRRLGYRDFRVELGRSDAGDRMRLVGRAGGRDFELVGMVLDRLHHAGRSLLFVNWLTLRHPRAGFTASRPRLPGQEVPGLGLAREAGELLGQMARRLGLAGVAFRPAAMHVAFSARRDFSFADPARQGRFEALLRDTAHLPLIDATRAVAEGRVALNGARYAWEPDVMVHFLERAHRPPASEVAQERERCRFVVHPDALPEP